MNAAERARQARPARAEEPCAPEPPPCPELEAHRLCIRPQLELARFEDHPFARRLPRGPGSDVAPDHQADQLVGRQSLDVPVRDHTAVLEDGRAVGEAEDLRQTMRDVEDAETARPKLLDDAEHPVELGSRQDRRRLVEDQEARLEDERARGRAKTGARRVKGGPRGPRPALPLGHSRRRPPPAEPDVRAYAVERLASL